MRVATDRNTTAAFLKWIYSKNETVVRSCPEITFGLLQLGLEFDMLDLVTLVCEMEMPKKGRQRLSCARFWQFYNLLTEKEMNLEIVAHLRIFVVKSLAR